MSTGKTESTGGISIHAATAVAFNSGDSHYAGTLGPMPVHVRVFLLRRFLTHLLPDKGTYFVASPRPAGNVFDHAAFRSIDEMAQVAIERDDEGRDAYFACASYERPSYVDAEGKTRRRTAENARWVRSFWLDIDCGKDKAQAGTGYATTKDALRALIAFIEATGLPEPTVVASGGGLHCYWILTNTVEKDQWGPVARRLKLLTINSDPPLLADQSRTADIASVLRPVGTHNWKPTRKGAEVRLLHEAASVSLDDFAMAVADADTTTQITRARRIGDPTANSTRHANLLPTPTRPADFSATKIVAGCQQFSWANAHQADVPEPMWRAMVGTLYLTDQPDIIHTFSDQHPNYTGLETEEKARRWKGGGVTCTALEALRPGGCVGCPYKGKINSPSALGYRGTVSVVAARNGVATSGSTALPLDRMINPSDFPFVEQRGKRLVPLLHADNMKYLLDAYGFTISYNVITKEADEQHPTMKIRGDNAKDVFLSRVKSLCAQNGMKSDGMELHISAIAQVNERNPVVRYLERLEWDGMSRIDALVAALNVPGSGLAAARIAVHRMLIQACAAADAATLGMAANPVAKPKFEYVLILVGVQGAKKSSFVHDVVPRDLRQYVRESTTVNTKDRDSIKQAISYWICELGEIDVTFTRSGSSAMKAFLSQYHDVIRLPYGRATSKFARRTMFMGSVNEFDFLRDRTGNRRYLPIMARSSLAWSDAEIDQLWAEVWQQYTQGVQWWPTDAEAAILATIADAHLEKTAVEEKLRLAFDWQGVQTVAEGRRLSTVELWELCFDTRPPTMPEMKATADAVRRLWRANGSTVVNGEDHAPRADGKLVRVYRDKGKSCGFVMPKRC